MTRLSVNVNKVATLRNARGGNLPDLIKFAKDCERYGAEGITVHPRPDERHIRYQDVQQLSPILSTEFNIEGYPSKEFLELVHDVKPAQVTLVPDPPGVLTSSAGWNAIEEMGLLKEVIEELVSNGMRVSIFMETDKEQIAAAVDTGTDRIELYTGPYAEAYPKDPQEAIKAYKEAASYASELGLGVNAGHDLNLENLSFFHQEIPQLEEVSIGHALICDALYYGIENTIQQYLRKLA